MQLRKLKLIELVTKIEFERTVIIFFIDDVAKDKKACILSRIPAE